MDQTSFRKLLQTPNASSSSSASASSAHVRGSLLVAATAGKSKKAKTIDASQPAFKPRQLKKGAKGETYRNRAEERRVGAPSDYAQVEALADEFERRNADNEDRDAVEEQRKYLGGDSEHTVLVKGLDFALLEQARARAAAESAATDDVSLEQAFLESAAQPRKRTRAEILSELKSKRGAGALGAAEAPAPSAVVDPALEAAKKAGKFKPIGFKPVGGAAEKVKRKKKVKAGEPENGERRKKRKVVPASTTTTTVQEHPEQHTSNAAASPEHEALKQPEASPSSSVTKPPQEPEPVDEDFDIFANAGEYTGVDLGDSDEEDKPGTSVPARDAGEEGEVREDGVPRPRKWLATSDDEREEGRAVSHPPERARSDGSRSRSGSPQRRPEEDGELQDEEEEEERPMRLQPLASSVMPSIKDLLAMSEEAEKADKRRARKEKKKGGGGAAGEGAAGGNAGGRSEKETKAKVDRDYQK
ncbi:Protein Red [Trametes pubescens]|uniref:Protein Red n=1 Tax=Trametes pubescens TaxID=154538 RepID=A0A1M2W241_TRAPU|nr:Protein Red [Trametes pubescens]